MGYKVSRLFGTTYRFKVFLIFAVYIALISTSFTIFFINHQSNRLRTEIIGSSTILVENFALNSKIAVFTKNKNLLDESIAGILQRSVVVEASLHDTEGTFLAVARTARLQIEQQRNPLFIPPSFLAQPGPYIHEYNESIEFVAKITSSAKFFSEKDVRPEMREGLTVDPLIGYARILIDKRPHRKPLRSLLYESIMMGAIFIVGCFCGVYLLARMITSPIHQLTRAVEILGTTGVAEKVAITSDDEIGNLAKSFNAMAESLRNREQHLQESKSRLSHLSGLILNAQEDERRRLARELHDDLGQSLALLKIKTFSLAQKLQDDKPQIKADCANIDFHIGQIIENIRRLSQNLSPVVLEDLGLTKALNILAIEFSHHYNCEVQKHLTDIDHLLSPNEQTNLYRFCQEALTNIHKHADAKKISIVVEYKNNYITVTISDNGRGFDFANAIASDRKLHKMGLTTLEERATMLQGIFTIRSSPGMGTDVIIQIPTEEV